MVYIGVIGTGKKEEPYYSLAYETGKLIAKRRGIVVCGGLGGVMEAAARGANEEGGVCIGIVPGRTRSRANPHLTYVIPTGMGELRNGIIVRTSDVFIAIGGGYGTLSEISLAKKTGKEVISLKSWEYNKRSDFEIEKAETPQEAVEKAFQHTTIL